MGWTFHYDTPVSIKAEIDRMINWANAGDSNRVLKSAMVGSTYYAAVEIIRGGKRQVSAAIFLTTRNRGEWGYKDMDETMGPVASKCPKSILDLLTPTDSEWANQWRERCRKNLLKTKVKFKSGDVVEYRSTQYRLDRPAGPRRGWNATRVSDGMLFRIMQKQLAASTLKEAA